jgi:hypothetical protein
MLVINNVKPSVAAIAAHSSNGPPLAGDHISAAMER